MNEINYPRRKRWIFITVGIILYVIFLSVPFFLTSIQPKINSLLNWDNPSVIATVVSGITAPLLSAIAIWITFEAFWVQYEANLNQINISEKQISISEKQNESGEVQSQDLKIERFENRFFNFIKLLHDIEKDTYIPHIGSSKQAYHFMFYEFKAICYQIITYEAYKNLKNRREYELNQAFHLFINGVSKSSISRLSEDSKKVNLIEIKKMNEYLLKLQDKYLKKGNMPQYLKDYNNEGVRLFDGHRLHIVPFYRTFCMTLQYLYKAIEDKVIDDITLYRNILLAQFSEHEIALLRIMYLYRNSENLMFIQKRYEKRIDHFFKETMLEYIISRTMNTESDCFVDA